MRLGINNLTDQDPPLVDTALVRPGHPEHLGPVRHARQAGLLRRHRQVLTAATDDQGGLRKGATFSKKGTVTSRGDCPLLRLTARPPRGPVGRIRRCAMATSGYKQAGRVPGLEGLRRQETAPCQNFPAVRKVCGTNGGVDTSHVAECQRPEWAALHGGKRHEQGARTHRRRRRAGAAHAPFAVVRRRGSPDRRGSRHRLRGAPPDRRATPRPRLHGHRNAGRQRHRAPAGDGRAASLRHLRHCAPAVRPGGLRSAGRGLPREAGAAPALHRQRDARQGAHRRTARRRPRAPDRRRRRRQRRGALPTGRRQCASTPSR